MTPSYVVIFTESWLVCFLSVWFIVNVNKTTRDIIICVEQSANYSLIILLFILQSQIVESCSVIIPVRSSGDEYGRKSEHFYTVIHLVIMHWILADVSLPIFVALMGFHHFSCDFQHRNQSLGKARFIIVIWFDQNITLLDMYHSFNQTTLSTDNTHTFTPCF